MANEIELLKNHWLALADDIEKLPEPFSREIFLMECRIAGTTFVKDVGTKTEKLAEGDVLALRRDPDNAYDDRAIAVHMAGDVRIGWIPQERNEVVSRLMDAGKMLYAKVKSKAWSKSGKWLMIDVALFMRDT